MVQAIRLGTKTQTRRIFQEGKPCPFVDESEMMWVRETWAKAPIGYVYKADYLEGVRPESVEKWQPSIFMPKEACRLKLRIKNIRVERLQDISDEDAIAEGIEQTHLIKNIRFYRDYINGGADYPVESFKSLWILINGRESWDNNPLVWVIKFEEVLLR
jgi:hypothetical protein